MDKYTTIGIITVGIRKPSLCTVEMLKEEIAWAALEEFGANAIMLKKFDYDPFTGKKIEWDKILILLK